MPDILLLDRQVVASRRQMWCDIGGEAAILNIARGVYYTLNGSAARIWSLAQQPIAVRDIERALLDEYDVEPDQCRRDLLALLEDLQAHGLVEVIDGVKDNRETTS